MLRVVRGLLLPWVLEPPGVLQASYEVGRVQGRPTRHAPRRLLLLSWGCQHILWAHHAVEVTPDNLALLCAGGDRLQVLA